MEFVSQVSLNDDLRESYRRFVDQHPDLWVIFFLTADFPMGYANRAALSFLGRPAIDGDPVSWAEALGPADPNEIALFQELREGRVHFGSWRPSCATTDRIWLESWLTPLPDVDGMPFCVVARQRIRIAEKTVVAPKRVSDDALDQVAGQFSTLFNRLCALKYATHQIETGIADAQGVALVRLAVAGVEAELAELAERPLVPSGVDQVGEPTELSSPVSLSAGR